MRVLAADDQDELNQALSEGVDLLLLNREMPYGFEEDYGVELIRKLRAKHPRVKMMLVSNYAEAQAQAIAAGAVPGFGKREIGSKKIAQLINDALGAISSPGAGRGQE